MEQFKTYIDLSEDTLFENWNRLEHLKTYPMYRWSTGDSRINLREMSGVWCSIRLSGGGRVSPKFTVLLDGQIKVLEGETNTSPQNFVFYIPQGTQFFSIRSQGWRPCDYSSSRDGRTLGVGLSEVCFYTEGRPMFNMGGKLPSSFAQELIEEMEVDSPEKIIIHCEKIAKNAKTSRERIAAVYGGMMCLLKCFPSRKLSEVDIEKKLQSLIASIDMPFFDEGDEVATVFVDHANCFWRTSLDAFCKENWKNNVAFLQKKAIDGWKIEELSTKIFAVTESLVLYFVDGNIYLNYPKKELLKKLYFQNIVKQLSPHEQWLILRSARMAVSLKSYRSLKSLVEAPWIATDGKLLQEIRRFKHFCPHSEKYDFLMGKFFQRRGDIKRAYRYAYIGLLRRRLDCQLSELMGNILTEMGEYKEAAGYYGRMLAKNAVKKVRHWMVLQNNELNASERTKACIARLLVLAEEKSSDLREACVEELGRVVITDRARYGSRQKLVYNDGKFSVIDFEDDEIHGIKSRENIFYPGLSNWGNLVTEYWQGNLHKEIELNCEGQYIFPLMIFRKDTKLDISYNGLTVRYDQGKVVRRFLPNKWQYLRLEGKCKIVSEQDFIAGKIIPINSPFKKRRLVVNLLVDALSMEEIHDNMEKFMPNTYRFFSNGTIFGQAYGISDWTHPCISSMFYGLDLRRNQLYHSRINLNQLPGYKSVADELQAQGYFCYSYVGDVARSLSNEAYCGFDMYRLIGQDSEAYIEETIKFLQTVPTNIFLNMHFDDVHDTNFNPHETWTRRIDTLGMPFDEVMKSDMFVSGNEQLTSELRREGRLSVYMHAIKELDRKLGIIYEYLERNFTEEDYLVVLHSDHGGGRYPLGTQRHHAHTCLMVRGDGVPHLGMVDNEIVSALDWFSIFEHFCEFKPKFSVDAHLPKAFGGPGRDYAVTQRLYPNQNYDLVINDLSYEYNCRTKDVLSYDAKVDMGTLECHLYRHTESGREEVFDQELLDKYFALAYEEAKYFDEPIEDNHDNLFENLLEKQVVSNTLVTVIIDGRDDESISSALRSFFGQTMKLIFIRSILRF